MNWVGATGSSKGQSADRRIPSPALLQSIEITANASRLLAERCIDGLEANVERNREMIEKSMAMAQNLALQEGGRMQDHYIAVVDLAESRWDWDAGEPPTDRPEYYLRYCKTFSRMGGRMSYITADNRDFLLQLCRELGVG